MAESTVPERPERRVGSYRLLEPLGSGGMSSVFRAVHEETGVEVALKILPRNLAKNRTLLQRFLREARNAEALEHPNIVAIYDRGVDDGRHYLVLEYVEGGDLHDLVKARGPLPEGAAVALIRTVAEGLKFAAERGVIHRDIKPANLLMTAEGGVKVADLGLALQAESEDERVTREGTTVGTVDYMAPEQARDSRGTSVRSDIYSLGCTFYFLVTGQPPYPGGDLADKLTRHCTAPVPDPRDVRPDLSTGVGHLIRRMMAKRPERRFEGYDDLIAALDALPPPGGADRPADAGPEPLYAILAEDEGDEPDALRETGLMTLPGFSLPAGLADEPGPIEVSLADLARLDGDGDAPPSRPGRIPEPVPPPALPTAVDAPMSTILDDEEAADDEGAMSGGRAMSASERSWIKLCIVSGLALVLFVIGADQIRRAASSSAVQPGAVGEAGTATGDSTPDAPLVASVRRAGDVPTPNRTTARPKVPPPSPLPVVEEEPVDPVPGPVLDIDYPTSLEARYRPDWASVAPPDRLAGTFLTVRRVPVPGDPAQRPSLRSALVDSGGTVVVADNGPFFESAQGIAAGARQVRAGAGFRPIVCLVAPSSDGAAQRESTVEVDGRDLTLDGLDLIVNVRDLPRGESAIFGCRGGSLTLRDCTITVVNRDRRPVSLVRVQPGRDGRTSRVCLDRTLVRGDLDGVVLLAGGSADVYVVRSVLVNGQGSAIVDAGPGNVDRRVFVARSIVASRGPALEVAAGSAGLRARPLLVRALGSSFARVESSAPASFAAVRGAGGMTADLLSWDGESNVFSGWSSWLTVGADRAVHVAGLTAVRTVWPGTDARSHESQTSWTLGANAETVTPAAFRALAGDRAYILSRVAAPSPYLFEKTLGRFASPFVPGLGTTTGPVRGTGAPGPARRPRPGILASAGVVSDEVRAGPGGGAEFGSPPPGVSESFPPPAGVLTARGASPSGVRQFWFDTGAAPFQGDLGRFLAAKVKPTDRLVRVRAWGQGVHDWSRFRMPDGVSLEIVVVPDARGGVPTWSAIGASGDALIEVNRAGLVVEGVGLVRDGSDQLGTLFLARRGHLVVRNCRLRSSGPAEPGGGSLIDFRAPGSLPLRPEKTVSGTFDARESATAARAGTEAGGIGSWPFETSVDRPTCLVTDSVLISSGDVLTAEAGRGLVALSQCAVAAGGTAFDLRPDRVARSRLDADLWLDHCTVASESTFVRLGPWRGTDPGPDRPWLVTSHRCAFFATYQRPPRESVLLRADSEALAHGAIFWQGNSDASEVPCLVITGEAQPTEGPRNDVVAQWVAFWGPTHIRAMSGPQTPYGAGSARTVVRLKPGNVEPGDLAIDSTFPTGVGPPTDVGVDLKRLGITPTPRGRRR